MKFISLGGVNEHGRNCFLIKGNEHSILLDCGLSEKDELPSFSLTDISSVDALFLSHSHLDHCGALSSLFASGFKGKIFLTEDTYHCLSFNKFIPYYLLPNHIYNLYPWLKMKTFRSGHCFGSLSFVFKMEDKKIVYTGDYLEASLFMCDKLRDIDADFALIDGAYQNDEKDIQTNRKELLSLINKEKKVLLPLPKNGRSMEVISLLNENQIPYHLLNNNFYLGDQQRYLRKPIYVKDTPKSNVLLMDDPQLAKKENKKLIDQYDDYHIIFTGTIDRGSYSEKLLNERSNTFFRRINVHQTLNEAIALKNMNHFQHTIIFHNKNTSQETEIEF